MEFAHRDRVPDHWRTFGARCSPLTLAPRNAANPLNAILNYLYTLAEVETRITLIGRGPRFWPGALSCRYSEASLPGGRRDGAGASTRRRFRSKPCTDADVFGARFCRDSRRGVSSQFYAHARTRTNNGDLGEACSAVRRIGRETRRSPCEERPWRYAADPAGHRERSCPRQSPLHADRRARGAESGANRAHRNGLERVPELRCKADDPQACVLRRLLSRSVGGVAARLQYHIPVGGTGTAESNARGWLRSRQRSGGATSPRRGGFRAAPSRCNLA
jgi:hypothetical protein